MIRDIITNKWFIGAIAFLIIFAGACYLWYQHDTAPDRKAAADALKLLRQHEAIQKAEAESKTGQAADTPVESETLPAERSRNETTSVTDKTKPTQAQAAAPAQNADTAEVRVSPFGFGAYPEIPADYPFNVNWESKDKEGELAARVMIKAWNKGERFVGAKTDGETGKLYLNYPNTVYVQYTETVLPNGSIRRTRRVSGPPDIVIPPLGKDFPPNIRVLDYDSEGLDPYEYLGISP